MRLQGVRGDAGVIAPHFMQQHVAGDHALVGAIEIFQDRGFLLGQPDLAIGYCLCSLLPSFTGWSPFARSG